MSPRVLGLASAGVGPRPTYSIICVAGGDVYSILYVVDFAVTGLEIPVEIALPSLNLRPLVCSSSNYPSAIRNVPRLGALTSSLVGDIGPGGVDLPLSWPLRCLLRGS